MVVIRVSGTFVQCEANHQNRPQCLLFVDTGAASRVPKDDPVRSVRWLETSRVFAVT